MNTLANNILKENYRIADLGRQLFHCRWIYSQCALIRDPEEKKKIEKMVWEEEKKKESDVGRKKTPS